MYNIEFYENSAGYSEIREFLDLLLHKAKTQKEARIQYGQIARCIQLLQENGTDLPIEVVKHLEDGIWELRPGCNRVFFFYYADRTYVLLHHYRKKSRKTPAQEITRAKAERKDYLSRGTKNELE